MNHVDKFGKPVNVDDYVLYSYRHGLTIGQVIAVTPKMIRVARIPLHVRPHKGTLVYSVDTYVIPGQEVTFYLLKGK